MTSTLSLIIYIHSSYHNVILSGMNDFSLCPICSSKLRSISISNKFFNAAPFVEKTCSNYNHTLQFTVSSNKINYIKFSLDPKYSAFFKADFINNNSTIITYFNSKPSFITLPFIPNIDFPHLTSLKLLLQSYIILS